MERTREEEYEICKERGHQSSGAVLLTMPPQYVCRWCGTHYREVATVEEMREGCKDCFGEFHYADECPHKAEKP